MEFFHTLPMPSDRNPTLHRSSRIGILLAFRSESYAPAMWPLDRCSQVDWTASIARSRGRPMEITWSSSRRRSDAHDASTWRKVIPVIISLTMYFRHVFDLAIAWTRVHAIDALRSEPAGSDAYRAATRPAR